MCASYKRVEVCTQLHERKNQYTSSLSAYSQSFLWLVWGVQSTKAVPRESFLTSASPQNDPQVRARHLWGAEKFPQINPTFFPPPASPQTASFPILHSLSSQRLLHFFVKLIFSVNKIMTLQIIALRGAARSPADLCTWWPLRPAAQSFHPDPGSSLHTRSWVVLLGPHLLLSWFTPFSFFNKSSYFYFMEKMFYLSEVR